MASGFDFFENAFSSGGMNKIKETAKALKNFNRYYATYVDTQKKKNKVDAARQQMERSSAAFTGSGRNKNLSKKERARLQSTYSQAANTYSAASQELAESPNIRTIGGFLNPILRRRAAREERKRQRDSARNTLDYGRLSGSTSARRRSMYEENARIASEREEQEILDNQPEGFDVAEFNRNMVESRFRRRKRSKGTNRRRLGNFADAVGTMSSFGPSTGLGLSRLMTSFGTVFTTLASLGPVGAALAVGFGALAVTTKLIIAGFKSMYKFIRRIVEEGDKVNLTSRQTRISSGNFTRGMEDLKAFRARRTAGELLFSDEDYVTAKNNFYSMGMESETMFKKMQDLSAFTGKSVGELSSQLYQAVTFGGTELFKTLGFNELHAQRYFSMFQGNTERMKNGVMNLINSMEGVDGAFKKTPRMVSEYVMRLDSFKQEFLAMIAGNIEDPNSLYRTYTNAFGSILSWIENNRGKIENYAKVISTFLKEGIKVAEEVIKNGLKKLDIFLDSLGVNHNDIDGSLKEVAIASRSFFETFAPMAEAITSLAKSSMMAIASIMRTFYGIKSKYNKYFTFEELGDVSRRELAYKNVTGKTGTMSTFNYSKFYTADIEKEIDRLKATEPKTMEDAIIKHRANKANVVTDNSSITNNIHIYNPKGETSEESIMKAVREGLEKSQNNNVGALSRSADGKSLSNNYFINMA